MYDLSQLDGIAVSLDDLNRDCLITLALKIIDDTCKMNEYERSVFMMLYDALPKAHSHYFGKDVFSIISEARYSIDSQVFELVTPLRKAGMNYVTRPHMKAFKDHVRAQLQRACA